jgi:hypothetical protein
VSRYHRPGRHSASCVQCGLEWRAGWGGDYALSYLGFMLIEANEPWRHAALCPAAPPAMSTDAGNTLLAYMRRDA